MNVGCQSKNYTVAFPLLSKKMKMSILNKSAFHLHSKNYKPRTITKNIPTNNLGNRTGRSTNRIPPRNF